MTLLRIHSDAPVGNTVRQTWFIGEEGFTLQNMGRLHLRIGEWQLLGAAMLLGAERTRGNLKVEHTGWSPDKEAA